MEKHDYIGDKIFYKVFNAANFKNGYEYDDGVNDLRNTIRYKNGKFIPYMCCFTDIRNIFCLLDYGPCFRRVLIPSNIPFIYDNTDNVEDQYYSDIIEVGPIMLWTAENIKKLIELGADISVRDYRIINWSFRYNFEVFYFLQNLLYETEVWENKMEEFKLKGMI